MDSKQVTIFGGSGFVGRHTVRALARAGWRVKVACRKPNQGFFLKPLGTVGQVALVRCDITDPADVASALRGSDAAVNLVGILAGHFEDIHAQGAENIAKAAVTAGLTSLVHVSAIGADSSSHSRYAQTKAEGEKRVRATFPEAVILRPSIVFGPEDSFFNKFAGLARILPALPLIGGGHTRMQPVFVGDLAAAIAATLGNPDAAGRTYELGGPMRYSFRQLMQIVLAQTGRKRLLVPVPFVLASFKAFFLQFLPGRLLTPDQVKLLKSDNVVSPTALGLKDLGITPTTVEAEVGSYLWRYRAKGQYAELAAEKR
jgi:NADH dehydrogenase